MNMRTSLIAMVLAILIPASLFAADSKKEELRKRFEDRYPQIQSLKQDGTIGETDEGYVEFVDRKDSKSADLVDQENVDRKALYAQIAKDTDESAAVVAQHSAERNFKKAKTGEYLKVSGKWHKKADGEGAKKTDGKGSDDAPAKKKPKKPAE